jgi:hypothetical protein
MASVGSGEILEILVRSMSQRGIGFVCAGHETRFCLQNEFAWSPDLITLP